MATTGEMDERAGKRDDREFVLTADIATFSMAELLGWIHEARKSGVLEFRHGGHEKSVFFRRGKVAFATSNQRVDRIGESLLRGGVITLGQLRAAEQDFKSPGRFGTIFVEQGHITPRELWQGIEDQVEEIVRSLFLYPTGSVDFWAGNLQPDNVVRLSLSTRRLVAEGMQRREELQKFLGVLERSGARLRTLGTVSGQLAGEERSLYEALERAPAFSEACRALGADPLAAARTVQLLRLVGAVRLVRGNDGSFNARMAG